MNSHPSETVEYVSSDDGTKSVEYEIEGVDGVTTSVNPDGTPVQLVETAQQKIARLKRFRRYLKRMQARVNHAAMREEEKAIQKQRNRKKNKAQKESRKRNRK